MTQRVPSSSGHDDAVIVHIRLSNGAVGQPLEFDHLMDVENAVIEAIDAADAGVHDGHEIGEGEFTLFSYGPDGAVLWDAIRPALLRFHKCRGARVEIRRENVETDERTVSFHLDSQ